MLHKLHNPIESCELKFNSKIAGEFEGYASVFGGVDSYGDTIVHGAYEKTLKKAKFPPMFFNHNSLDIPVGDWKSLEEDAVGLRCVGVIDMLHRDGPSLYSAMKRGAVDGLSVGYRVPKGGGTENDHGGLDLTEIDLREISPVNFPADEKARIVAVKYDIELITSLKEAEQFLRDSGYSKSTALAFVSRVKDLSRSESVTVENEITKHDLTNHLVDFIGRCKASH